MPATSTESAGTLKGRVPKTQPHLRIPRPLPLAVGSHPDLFEICTKCFISLQISSFACISLPALVSIRTSPKGLILLAFCSPPTTYGLVAQSVEQRPFKPLVAGSSPAQPTILNTIKPA